MVALESVLAMPQLLLRQPTFLTNHVGYHSCSGHFLDHTVIFIIIYRHTLTNFE